jgi:hypothetical protein
MGGVGVAVRRRRGRRERGARGEEGTGDGENGSPPRGDAAERHGGGGGWRQTSGGRRLTSSPAIGFLVKATRVPTSGGASDVLRPAGGLSE